VANACEHGNEASGEFLGQLSDCQLLREESALWIYLGTEINLRNPQFLLLFHAPTLLKWSVALSNPCH
jgi:hypothetical protein